MHTRPIYIATLVIFTQINERSMQMKKSQKERIIDYIKQYGSISSWEAYKDLGVTQLGARIDGLERDGYRIRRDWETSTNRYGEEVKYKRYWMEE